MSQSSRKRATRHHNQQKVSTRTSYRLRPTVAIIMLLFGLSISVAVFTVSTKSPSVYGSGITGTGSYTPVPASCGVSGKPACLPTPIFWAQLSSTLPSDIIAAAKSTPMYQDSLKDKDIVGNALHVGTLASPVLVKPYRENIGMPEVWVIPVVNRLTNIPLAMLTFVYDPVHQRIRASEFSGVTGNMFYTTHRFPFVAASTATAIMQREIHSDIQIGSTADLIYFPPDHDATLKGTDTWTGGGTAVIDPIWRVSAANGHFYYVDHLGQHAHQSKEFMVDPAFPVMP